MSYVNHLGLLCLAGLFFTLISIESLGSLVLFFTLITLEHYTSLVFIFTLITINRPLIFINLFLLAAMVWSVGDEGGKEKD